MPQARELVLPRQVGEEVRNDFLRHPLSDPLPPVRPPENLESSNVVGFPWERRRSRRLLRRSTQPTGTSALPGNIEFSWGADVPVIPDSIPLILQAIFPAFFSLTAELFFLLRHAFVMIDQAAEAGNRRSSMRAPGGCAAVR